MVASKSAVDDAFRARRASLNVLGTEGTGWDVAEAVLWLAGPASRWVTGIVIPVDAGAASYSSALLVSVTDAGATVPRATDSSGLVRSPLPGRLFEVPGGPTVLHPPAPQCHQVGLLGFLDTPGRPVRNCALVIANASAGISVAYSSAVATARSRSCASSTISSTRPSSTAWEGA
jgi:hypothetical protein